MGADLEIDPELLAWLKLARLPRLTPETTDDLVRLFGGAARAVDPAAGCPAEAAGCAALLAELRSSAHDADVRRELELAALRGWRLLHRGGPGYPERLEHLGAPPRVLAVRGVERALGQPAVAIVGSRRASDYGRRMAQELAAALARVGVVVVSGLARGIDGAAHAAALDAGGTTVAVMGTGFDRIYPREHAPLAERIAASGALATEFGPGIPPAPENFPRRNRIIAALADVVIVVEAALRSGALITARLALALGREVLAVPGRVGDPMAAGTLALLRDGAPPALGALDALLALPSRRFPELAAAAAAALRGEEAAALAAEGPGPSPAAELGAEAEAVFGALPRDEDRQVDELAAAAGLPLDAVLPALFALQMAGLAEALPGARFRRTVRLGAGRV